MMIECAGFEFDFTDAIDVFVFDETDKTSVNYHGLSHAMKAIDLIVELENNYLFVEIKDFYDPQVYQRNDHFNYLRESLKYKYRDTWLYRWAENKIDKPIKYICMLELENGLISRMSNEIQKQLPVSSASTRWVTAISSGSAVVNFDLWTKRFKAWPVVRLASA